MGPGFFPQILVTLVVAGSRAEDLWCGKVYTAGVPEIIPDGWLYAPIMSSTPLVKVHIAPRYSIYLESDTSVDFLIDVESSTAEFPYEGSPPDLKQVASQKEIQTRAYNDDVLRFEIHVDGKLAVADQARVESTDNVFLVTDVAQTLGLTPRLQGYPVTLTGMTMLSNSYANATTTLFYLPEKSTGSVVKIDHLSLSLVYRSAATNGSFIPVFPYGFYGSYSGFFNDTSTYADYASRSFTVLNPVVAFTDTDLRPSMEAMDAAKLLFQYNMRGSYQNLSSVAEQIPLVKDHASLLTYYTADEPDGWGDPLNNSRLVYELLSRLDKYKPVALVLNCRNYHFVEYASGADVLMVDPYPVGINASHSFRGTPCNTTYGDCGCDDCAGELQDVPRRIDDLYRYGEWIGQARKPVWSVPQAFSDKQYWKRDPTREEVWVMDLTAFNHGAKGRLAWLYPTSSALEQAAERLARVVTTSPVMDALVGVKRPVLYRDAVAEGGGLDIALWRGFRVGGEEKYMVGVANVENVTVSDVRIDMRRGAGLQEGYVIESVPWGAETVTWTMNGTVLAAEGGVPALGTSYVMLRQV